MRRVAIYVFMGASVPRDIVSAPANPGIGGTSFSSIRLAVLLARAHPAREVVVVTDRPAEDFDRCGHPNLSFACWDEWCADRDDCVIVSAGQLGAPATLAGIASAGRVVLWSHHPFDRELRKRDRLTRLDAIVSPGSFAAASNRLLGARVVHVPHVTDPADDRARIPRAPGEPFDLVFMSSGLPIKGLSDALAIWRRVRRRVPTARLRLVGVSDEPELAAADLQDDVVAGRLILHGVLGVEKSDLLRTCHAGIVNPRGLTESWCLTAFEMMARGVPIVSSGRHGMYESMRHLPELRAQTIRGMARRIVRLADDPARWQRFSDRARTAVAEAHAAGPSIADRWARVTGLTVDDGSVDLRRPVWPLPAAPLRLAAAVLELVWYRLVLRRRWYPGRVARPGADG